MSGDSKQDVRVRSHVSGSELAQTEPYTFLNIVQPFHLTVEMREPVVKKKKKSQSDSPKVTARK